MEKRESGFYWVKVAGRPPEWWVGEYFDTTGDWCLCGLGEEFNDSDFLEIDERQIKRQ